MIVRDWERSLKPLLIFTVFVKPWCYRAYESRIFSNLQITSFLVVGKL